MCNCVYEHCMYFNCVQKRRNFRLTSLYWRGCGASSNFRFSVSVKQNALKIEFLLSFPRNKSSLKAFLLSASTCSLEWINFSLKRRISFEFRTRKHFTFDHRLDNYFLLSLCANCICPSIALMRSYCFLQVIETVVKVKQFAPFPVAALLASFLFQFRNKTIWKNSFSLNCMLFYSGQPKMKMDR